MQIFQMFSVHSGSNPWMLDPQTEKVDGTKNSMCRHLTYLVLHLENGNGTRDKYESLRPNMPLENVAVF